MDKIKLKNYNLDSLNMYLRIASTLTQSRDGRMQLSKLKFFDNLERLDPTYTKKWKSWNEIMINWLTCYEIFSRYDDINTSNHISLFCLLIAENETSEIVKLTLTILRNLSFHNANRFVLLNSKEFLSIVELVLNNGDHEDQLMMVTAIWSLIANNSKAKHVIRCSAIPLALSKLGEKLDNLNETGSSSIDLDYFDFINSNKCKEKLQENLNIVNWILSPN